MADYARWHADWKNRIEELTTPVSAEAMEHIETGVFNAQRAADLAQAAADSKIGAGDLGAHNADTTAVHGIADTSVLETLTGAQAKADAAKARAAHTGTQSADTVVDGTANKVYPAADKTKLAGIATGATVNSSDATLLTRANHTGTQDADTIAETATVKMLTAAERGKLTDLPSETFTHRVYDGAVYPARGTVPSGVKVMWINMVNTDQPSIGGGGAEDGDITLVLAS